ncbi:MAG: S1 RNA-binding domain-containing protein, partial [Rhodospirillaceae bacterium]|nr:S1 RNA-binding domain-containing protein [Rhodospirillaceae bacterium]
YGAFVELEPGIEGLVHVSEMSWTKKNVHPGKIVSTSQEVEVQVLDVDPQKRRISLGLKQTQENPWDEFAVRFPGGTEIDGEVRNITEFGLFVGLPGDIDGMVHLSDISWEKTGEEALEDFTKGDMVKVKILEVDTDKERISLGIKQLSSDPFAESLGNIRKGEVVTATVSEVNDGGIEVKTSGGLVAFIRRSDLSRDRSEQRPDRFAVGEKVDAKVTNIDPSSRRISMSIKANEIAEEKTALAQFGSSDSGASLGDILGAAIRDKQQETQEMIGDTPAPEAAAEAPAEEEATEEAPAEEAAAEAPAEEAKEEDGAEKS